MLEAHGVVSKYTIPVDRHVVQCNVCRFRAQVQGDECNPFLEGDDYSISKTCSVQIPKYHIINHPLSPVQDVEMRV